MTEKEFDLPKMKRLYLKAKKAYYEDQSIMTDEEFDTLELRIKKLDPSWDELNKTGIVLTENKVVTALHVPMPSLNKVTADNPSSVSRAILKTIASHCPHAVLMDKLDGASIQLYYKDGKLKSIITRGNGQYGKLIFHFAPYLPNVPKHIQTSEPVLVIRAEVVLRRKDFLENWSGAYDSSRAVASGLLNRRDVHKALEDLRVVALRVLQPAFSVSAGLNYLDELGFETVPRRVLNLATESEETLTDKLSRYLDRRREKSEYDLDGLVIFSDANKLPAPNKDKPRYAVAFKKNDMEDSVTTKVTRVLWKASSHGILVPKAQIEPIEIDGSTIEYATLHNAKWARERGIGVGAIVRVIKSGGIIPKIISVVEPAEFKYPSKKTHGEYTLCANKINLELVDKSNSAQVQISKLTRFFKEMELDGFSEGLAVKMVAAGYTTVPEFLSMTESDFRKLPGITDSAKDYARTVAGLKENRHDITMLIPASGCFDRGVGRSRVKLLAEKAPHLIRNSPVTDEWTREIQIVAGQVFGETFASGWNGFLRWLKQTKLRPYIPKPAASDGSKILSGMMGSWTGYRDKDEERIFVHLGGTVIPFGGKTNVLFFRSDGKQSAKIEKAHAAGILTVSDAGPWLSQKAVEGAA